MITRLDQQIEQLENIVERRLDLCKATWNGTRCTLPANHEPAELHKFPLEFSTDAEFAGGTGAFAGQERRDFAENRYRAEVKRVGPLSMK
jgi:hypothetical protein